jgi:hypothetical protein
MNLFSQHVITLLHRAAWRDLVSDHQEKLLFKFICHVECGICVIITDFCTSSFVGSLDNSQMMRSVHASAPGLQFDGMELLRVVNESCRIGNARFTPPSATNIAEFTVGIVVDVAAGHQLRAAVKVPLMHTGIDSSFVKEFAVRPLLLHQTFLERLLQSLVEQRRISAEELASIARGLPLTTLMTIGDQVWQQELLVRCFPLEERQLPAVAVAPTSTTPTLSRLDSYIESPEEAQRKRLRDEERTRTVDKVQSEPSANLKKKIRKALR